jgi:hypothetical protein
MLKSSPPAYRLLGRRAARVERQAPASNAQQTVEVANGSSCFARSRRLSLTLALDDERASLTTFGRRLLGDED